MCGNHLFRHCLTLSFAATALLYFPAHAETEITGFAALEERWFIQDATLPGQNNSRTPSVIIEPEIYHISDDEKDTFTFRPFLRLDSSDHNRSHWDIRQADWLHNANDWEIRMGVSKVFWGVTESNHLVDIINQTDAVEDTDGEDKLGQPMIQSSWFSNYGTFRLLYLPYFRERTFTSRDGRLRGPMLIETEHAQYESSMKMWHPDLALRYTKVSGDWDIGLAHFYGTSREPRFATAINTDGDTVFNPFYDVINQSSLDLQYTTEDGWLWKLEALTRNGHTGSNRFYAASGGFEYTFYQVMESDADVGVLAEIHRDTRGQFDPATLLDDDIFIGGRLTMNDVDDTTFLAGIIIDRKDHSRIFNLEFEKRIGENWKLEADMRLFSHIDKSSPIAYLSSEDFMQLRIARYF